jgi:hypothetical protein
MRIIGILSHKGNLFFTTYSGAGACQQKGKNQLDNSAHLWFINVEEMNNTASTIKAAHEDCNTTGF